MAKLKVKQIEDLSLENGVITIGKNNTITPVTSVEAAENSAAEGYISGLSVSGNKLIMTKTTLPAPNDGKLKVQFGEDGTATETGFSANATSDATLTFAKVASTGAAGDVTISNIAGLSATNVQAALEALAKKTTDIAVTGAGAIVVADAETPATGKVVSLKIVDGEKVLSQTSEGLKTTLNLTYDSISKQIKLWGIPGKDPIAEVDATNFIKDGMLDSATYIELTEGQEGQAAGKYIKLTFNTAAGKDPVYVNVTALVDTYTAKANDWIELTNHEFSHKTTGNGELTFAGTSNDAAATPQFGETVEISIPTFTVDAAGHVTSKVGTTTAKFTLPKPEKAATYYQHYDSYELTATDATNGYVYLINVTSNGTPVVYLNGQSLVEGPEKDYTYSGTTIKVTLAALDCDLEAGDVLTYSYINTTAPTV